MPPDATSAFSAAMDHDPKNMCIGCGRANPAGLHLEFMKGPDGASTTFLTQPEHQGFPHRMHSAVLYLALIETMNWSLYAKLGRMGLPTRTSALEMTRRVDIGQKVHLAGRVVEAADATATVEATAHLGDRTPVGRLDRDYDLVDAKTMVERMGYERLPALYEGVWE